MALLEVVGPDGAGQRINLDAAELVVGRDATAGLRLRGAKISRRHARFYRVQNAVWVEDLNSANGVYINGERVVVHTLPTDLGYSKITEFDLSDTITLTGMISTFLTNCSLIFNDFTK
ncbi:MAG: FHA domain-containing protein [Hymenobacter sp.]|nr:MAG: FHA domain-containing protein [Hymenobacter sp.]